MIKIFIDLETTGLDVRKHSIHQLAGVVEADGRLVEEFNIRVAPNPKAQIDPTALRICNVTEAEIKAYQPMKAGYNEFVRILGRHVDKYNSQDKAHLVGYNNRSFDDAFLRAWFEQNGSNYFGSWFWSDSLDVLVLASEYLQSRRRRMKNFKLHTVAQELGITIE